MFLSIKSDKSTAAVSEQDKKRQLEELRKLRHSYARDVANAARLGEMAAKRLIKLHSEMDEEARKIAGDDYKQTHEVGFVEFESMDKQRFENDGVIDGPGLEDICAALKEMGRCAGQCASEPTPPQLPSE